MGKNTARFEAKVAAEEPRALHASEREQAILALLAGQRFVAFRDIEREIDASPATLRRDLKRLAGAGRIARVHGGAKLVAVRDRVGRAMVPGLLGVPFHENIAREPERKRAIGRAAAALCTAGEAVMLDGGSTTLQMCPHLDGLNLQVMTNSLHIVGALLGQPDTRVQVPGGAVFREQNIILAASGDDLMPRFHAPKLFMGAAAVGPQGIMQPDTGPSGSVVCALGEIDIVVTDSGIEPRHREMLSAAGVRVVVAAEPRRAPRMRGSSNH